MSLINSLFSWYIRKRTHQIELFTKYPHEVQREWFAKLIDTAAKTEYGQKFGFSDTRTIDQFRDRVPVKDYDGIKPEIDRILKGESDVMWPGEVRMFAKSSGTTSDKSKFIPITEDSLEECHYKGGKDLLALYYTQFPDTKLMEGRHVSIGGSAEAIPLNQSSYFGDLSAIILKNLPFWAALHRTPDLSVALNPDWETKLEQIADITMSQDITNIAGVPSWMLLLLQRIMEKKGASNILEVWPNLELYVHGGVNFSPYAKRFSQVFGSDSKVKLFETYNASEGFFGIQDNAWTDDLLLMLDYGIFYEFMPLDELGKEYPKTLTLDEVTCNVNYALVISTNGGLWRYLIGDTIQFTNLYPYRIKVSGRTRHFINAFGEEVIIENAENALNVACDRSNATIAEYTAGPYYMNENSAGAHEWAIEFEQEPSNLEYFITSFDNTLKSINSDYEAKRYQDKILKSPIVRVMPKGSFYRWMKYRDKLGGQNKVPRLSNDRRFLEELYQIEKIKV